MLPCPSASPGASSAYIHQFSDAIQPFCPLLSLSSPVFNLSQHQGLSQWVSSLHQVTKTLEFQFSINPSSECSEVISFRIDWLHLLAVKGTLWRKSFLQHHSSKASVLWHSAFFMIQLSHSYMTTGKNTALTRRTFTGKVMYAVYVGHSFYSKEQASFNFMALVTICSDFGAPPK